MEFLHRVQNERRAIGSSHARHHLRSSVVTGDSPSRRVVVGIAGAHRREQRRYVRGGGPAMHDVDATATQCEREHRPQACHDHDQADGAQSRDPPDLGGQITAGKATDDFADVYRNGRGPLTQPRFGGLDVVGDDAEHATLSQCGTDRGGDVGPLFGHKYDHTRTPRNLSDKITPRLRKHSPAATVKPA
ncbi:MAG TPA: hypothetical protein VFU90_16045 [Candidatus Tumulicola sp.]|nr:hypothetical protein [Candidatus Tumulicola sp.]